MPDKVPMSRHRVCHFVSQAAWSSPPGNSAGSEQTVVKERTVAFAPWTPGDRADLGTGAATVGGNNGSSVRRLSSGRRSARARRTSQHMQTSREQEVRLNSIKSVSGSVSGNIIQVLICSSNLNALPWLASARVFGYSCGFT